MKLYVKIRSTIQKLKYKRNSLFFFVRLYCINKFNCTKQGLEELVYNYRHTIDDQNKLGNTALIIATKYGKCSLVELLLKYNANVNIQNNKGYTALMCAVILQSPKCINLLLFDKVDLELRTKFKDTLLILSVKFNNIMLVKKLIDMNVNLNAQDYEGNTAIHFAIKKKHIECMNLLISHKADTDIANTFWYIPFNMIFNTCNLICFKELVDNITIQNMENTLIWSYISFLTHKRNNKKFKYLIEKCVNTNKDTVYRLLIICIVYNYFEMFKIIYSCTNFALEQILGRRLVNYTASRKSYSHFLIYSTMNEANIDTFVEKLYEPLPIMKAALYKCHENLIFLLNMNTKLRGYKPYNSIIIDSLLRFRRGNECVYTLIENEYNINFICIDSGITPLILTLNEESKDIFLHLIENGANINQPYSLNSDTALICAVKNNLIDFAKILIEFGADIYHKNFQGETAYDHAVKNNLSELIVLFETIDLLNINV